jgi:hypothetical protein
MEDIRPKLTLADIFGYLLAYLCWLLVAAVCMLTLIQIRNALNAMWPVISDNRWLIRPIDRFGLVFMGLVWLVYVIFVEQHYRSSITAIRTGRVKARMGGSVRPAKVPENKVMRMLKRMGLDILVRRFVPTLLAPIALFILAYLIYQLAFVLLAAR